MTSPKPRWRSSSAAWTKSGQLAHALADHSRVGDVCAVDVGAGEQQPGAVGYRGRRQLDALRYRRRSVVDAREQMKVQLDVTRRSTMIRAAGRDPVTIV
ncbi:MAG: hypothetical protein ABSG43_14950 [Solirubrobacteraceae bacterium]|jgi:hypothetical protein